jgi:tetratricopeptide (TPR) repeat protein
MWVHETDLRDLPYPVASPLSRARRALARDVPDKALFSLIGTVEEALRFAAAIELAVLVGGGYRADKITAGLLQKKKSLGDRGKLFLHCLRRPEIPGQIPLGDGLLDRGRQQSLETSLNTITNLRNRLFHEPPRGSDAHRELLAAVIKELDALSPLITWLQSMRLVSIFRPPTAESETATVIPWMGPVPVVDDESLVIPADALTGTPVRAGQALVRYGDRFLVLNPFVVVRDDPSHDQPEMYLLDRLVVRPNGRAVGEWVNLTSTERPVPTGAEDELSPVQAKLKPWLPTGGRRRDVDRDRYRFSTTPLLLERLLSRYVPRSDVPAAIDALIAQHKSGSLWITAGPGAGKSSVLAAMVQRYHAIQHFISQAEGRDNQPAILRSLIAQLLTTMETDEMPEPNDELLAQQFANLLVRRAVGGGQAGPTVIVLDAIDELGNEESIARFLRSLPGELPSGAYVVLSSRPLPAGIQIPAKFTRFELTPLSIKDIQAIANRHGLPSDPASCGAAYVASSGNPQFAVWALTLLRDNPDQRLSIADGFEAIIRPILDRPPDSAAEEELNRVLAVLTAAQRPLDLSAISSATGLRRAKTLAAIDYASSILSFGVGTVSLGHQVARDYLLDRRSIYGPEDADLWTAHRALVRLAASGQSSYPAGLTVWHAVRANDPELVRAFLGDKASEGLLARALVELATTDLSAVQRILDLLADVGRDVALEVVSRLCEMRLPAAAGSLLALDWGDRLSETDRAVFDLGIAVAREDIGRAIDLAQQLYPQVAASQASAAQLSKVAFLYADALRIEGRHEQALDLYTEALARASPGSAEEFLAAFHIADIDFDCGRLTQAERRLNELLELTRTQGDVFGEVRVLRELGHVPLARGEHESAARLYSEALDLALITNREGMLAECYVALAESLVPTDPARAIETGLIGAAYSTRADASREAGKSYYVQAEAHQLMGEYDRAVQAARQSLHMLTEARYASGIARAHLASADALVALGQFEEALADCREAYDYYARERIYPHHWGRTLTLLRNILDTVGKTTDADSLIHIAELPNVAEFPLLQ